MEEKIMKKKERIARRAKREMDGLHEYLKTKWFFLFSYTTTRRGVRKGEDIRFDK